jgi:hypothetical protein
LRYILKSIIRIGVEISDIIIIIIIIRKNILEDICTTAKFFQQRQTNRLTRYKSREKLALCAQNSILAAKKQCSGDSKQIIFYG